MFLCGIFLSCNFSNFFIKHEHRPCFSLEKYTSNYDTVLLESSVFQGNESYHHLDRVVYLPDEVLITGLCYCKKPYKTIFPLKKYGFDYCVLSRVPFTQKTRREFFGEYKKLMRYSDGNYKQVNDELGYYIGPVNSFKAILYVHGVAVDSVLYFDRLEPELKPIATIWNSIGVDSLYSCWGYPVVE